MLMSAGQLNSTTEHDLFALSQITRSGLLCGILVAVLIEIFHQYSLSPISLQIHIHLNHGISR